MLSYLIYKLGFFIANNTSIKFAYALARFLCDIHFLYSRTDRHAVLNNLRQIIPQEDDLVSCARKVFRNFGIYLVDFFRTPKLNKENVLEKNKVVNLNYIDEALKKGKGVIVVSAHLSNWELGGLIMSLLGYPISAVAYPHKEEKVNNFFNSQRESKGLEVIPVGNAARRCIENLKANKIVALVGDREFTPNGVIIDFFGKKTLIPKGPATLSLLTGAPLILGFVIREKENNFKLVFEKLLEFIPSGDREKDIFNLTREYLDMIEDCIRRYPDQWLMFRRYWL